MNVSASGREIIERLVKQSGITKKLASEILHVIPDIIEEGLKKDGEVRVKGLGTFRLKWVREKIGRNPKTGERVKIPSHNRVAFLPEQPFKEYVNRDFRLLSYKIIPPAEKIPPVDEIIPEPEIIEQSQYQEQYQPLPEVEPIHIPELEPEPESETEIGPPSRKRRIHWIIPLAVSVIIILSLIFYFRTFYKVSSRQPPVVSQQTEIDNRKSTTEIENRQSTIDNRQSESNIGKPALMATDSSRQPVPRPPDADEGSDSIQQESEPTQNSKLKTVTAGKHLFQLAREIYGNPYLWVLIYRENQDKIPDPDILISGKELVIPTLEGSPDHLTRKDSLAVSDGYRLLYEYFKVKEDSRKDDFFRAMERYKPL